MRSSQKAQSPLENIVDFYIIGLDLVVHNNNIKVLEIQNAYESNFKRAYELTGSNPIEKFIQKITSQFPNIQNHHRNLLISRELSNSATCDYAQQASTNTNSLFLNRGIEPLSRSKWLFYQFCNRHENLKKYIPETHVENLYNFLNHCKVDQTKKYLFKPGNLSQGNGIQCIPKSCVTLAELHETVKAYASNMLKHYPKTMSSCLSFLPFVLQEYLTDNNNHSLPVIRIYAAIGVTAKQSKNQSRLLIFLDPPSAYNHVRKEQNSNDFTLDNNNHFACDITPIVPKINDFLQTFFSTLLNNQHKICHKEWRILANFYTSNRKSLHETDRIHLLTQFCFAMPQEQIYSNSQLSLEDCQILTNFIVMLQTPINEQSDLERCRKIGLMNNIRSAFHALFSQNLNPYMTNQNYPLQGVYSQYVNLIENSKDNAIAKNKGQAPQENERKETHFIDFLSKTDIMNLRLTSKACLEMVTHYTHIRR